MIPVDFPPGTVWLAGAGPGDAGLLTLHAAAGLARADVVVYDALISQEVLALASPKAELVFAGKRGGRPSAQQADISRRLIADARRGLRVLRLKGGDPFVFGRGGEEALALARAGVPFRIVPGVSSGIGGLAYAGIPLTHRSTNAAVVFVTGHSAAGRVPDDVDWSAVARVPAIVLFMALKHMRGIADRLLANGRAGGTPVAIISSATTADQRVIVTDLAGCADDAAARNARPPALVVVGEVVRLREQLDWLAAAAVRP